MTKLHTQ